MLKLELGGSGRAKCPQVMGWGGYGGHRIHPQPPALQQAGVPGPAAANENRLLSLSANYFIRLRHAPGRARRSCGLVTRSRAPRGKALGLAWCFPDVLGIWGRTRLS